jgi:hypothetical protein
MHQQVHVHGYDRVPFFPASLCKAGEAPWLRPRGLLQRPCQEQDYIASETSCLLCLLE